MSCLLQFRSKLLTVPVTLRKCSQMKVRVQRPFNCLSLKVKINKLNEGMISGFLNPKLEKEMNRFSNNKKYAIKKTLKKKLDVIRSSRIMILPNEIVNSNSNSNSRLQSESQRGVSPQKSIYDSVYSRKQNDSQNRRRHG